MLNKPPMLMNGEQLLQVLAMAGLSHFQAKSILKVAVLEIEVMNESEYKQLSAGMSIKPYEPPSENH